MEQSGTVQTLSEYYIFSNLRQKYNVEYCTCPNEPTPCFVVTKSNGSKMALIKHDIGLYVHEVDMNMCNDHNNKIIATYPYLFALNTVESNEKKFTNQQIKNASCKNWTTVTLKIPIYIE